MPVTVSEEAIAEVAKGGNVEVFPLARPHNSNGFQAINVYLDEAGQLKRLPPNARASGLAELCGYKSVPFAGDVFIGRLLVQEARLQNVDFMLPEMSSDALWLKGSVIISFSL